MKTLRQILLENSSLDKPVYLWLNDEILAVYENVDECYEKSSYLLVSCYVEDVTLGTNDIDIFLKVGDFMRKYHMNFIEI